MEKKLSFSLILVVDKQGMYTTFLPLKWIVKHSKFHSSFAVSYLFKRTSNLVLASTTC